MKHSESIGKLAAALSKAQGSMASAKKDKTNPYFKSKYADLSNCWDVCRVPLAENQLALIQSSHNSESGNVVISSMIAHSSGEWVLDELELKPTKSDPQSFGSAITYGRRYLLSSMLGISSDDDEDGNAASLPEKTKQKPKSESNGANPVSELKTIINTMMKENGIKSNAEKKLAFNFMIADLGETVESLNYVIDNFKYLLDEFNKYKAENKLVKPGKNVDDENKKAYGFLSSKLQENGFDEKELRDDFRVWFLQSQNADNWNKSLLSEAIENIEGWIEKYIIETQTKKEK